MNHNIKGIRPFLGATHFKISRQFYTDWGKECFVHDPSGILWHIGEFFK